MSYLQFHDVIPYKHAFVLSNRIWAVVQTWDYLSKKTIGSQLIDSIDSISANIAEGFGRFSKKDKIKFYRYALGSATESLDWVAKAKVRVLINQEQYKEYSDVLRSLPREINTLIKITSHTLTV